MKKLLKYINEKYSSDLKEYNHISKAKHFYGYSDFYKFDIFVKVYDRLDKYDREVSVLKFSDLDILLDNFVFEEYFVIVYKFVDMKETSFENVSFYDCGKLLANFHKNMTENYDYDKNNFVDIVKDIERMMKKVEVRENFSKIKAVYDKLRKFENIYYAEFKNIPKKFLHGDFGYRNIKYINDKLTLIDFEFVKCTIAYMDVVKFFVCEELTELQKEEFFNGYNSIYKFDMPSDLLIKAIEFHTAVGIYSYTIKIKDKEFESYADKIMENLEKFLN